MTQAQPSIFARLWRWGVLPIIIGAVLMYFAQKITPWFPGSPYGLVTGTVLGFYLGYLARTWRALLIGLNGGALCGLGLDRYSALLGESLQKAIDMGHMDNILEMVQVALNNFSVSFSAFFLSLGVLSGFFRGGRGMFLQGCLRGIASGISFWLILRLTVFFDLGIYLLGHGLLAQLIGITIDLVCLIPLLLFSPLLKPPVDESSQPAPAAHQEEDHG